MRLKLLAFLSHLYDKSSQHFYAALKQVGRRVDI